MMRTALLFVASIAFVAASAETALPWKGIAKVSGADPNVRGNITFEQLAGKVHIVGTITGLGPCFPGAGADCRRGFHIHEKGDITNGCISAGGHFNPENQTHGAPTDAIRHVGDLGNVNINQNGEILLDFFDSQISLVGPHGIIGRAVVLHQGVDDLGLTSHADSKKTGNAGGRTACGVIGILQEPAVSGAISTYSFAGALVIPILSLVIFMK